MNSKLTICCLIVMSCIHGSCFSMATKTAMFVVAHALYEHQEYEGTKNVFTQAGINMLIASDQPGVAQAFGNKGRVSVDRVLDDITATDYDALVLIGGHGAQLHLNNEKCYDLVRQAFDNDKIIAAICVAPRILLNSNILDGRRVTGDTRLFFANEVKKRGCTYVNKPVVVDGNIITAEGPQAAQEFGNAIVKALTDH